MKYIICVLLLASTSGFAVDICKFEETWQFHDALEAKRIAPAKVSDDHKRFTSVEKQLIHRAVTQQSWLRNIALAESLDVFGDYYRGKPGSNAGVIKYFQIDGKQFVLVHYWPGDNEYGAYFMRNQNGSHKLVATIGDSFIDCK
jgi:hypothetical protein